MPGGVTTGPISVITPAGATNSSGLFYAAPTISGNLVTVNLTNVSNAQTVRVNLTGVSDGINSGDVHVLMGVLIGDVNGSGVVTSGDSNLCKAQALQPVTSANFRDDVNASGAITTGDLNIIKQNALTRLSSPP